MRTTSIEAYNSIRELGLLGELQFAVYAELYHFGPMTQGECWDRIRKVRKMNSSGCITSRFAELKRMTVINETGTRPCKVTGRKCIVWDVTQNTPVEYERKSKNQQIKELSEQVEEISQLVSKYRQLLTDNGLLFLS